MDLGVEAPGDGRGAAEGLGFTSSQLGQARRGSKGSGRHDTGT